MGSGSLFFNYLRANETIKEVVRGGAYLVQLNINNEEKHGRSHGLCGSGAVLLVHQLSYEDPSVGSRLVP